MNLQQLKQQLSQEIRVIGRNIEINEESYHVIGLVCKENQQLQMLLLKHNENALCDEVVESVFTHQMNLKSRMI